MQKKNGIARDFLQENLHQIKIVTRKKIYCFFYFILIILL